MADVKEVRAALMDMLITHIVQTGHAISVVPVAYGKQNQRIYLMCTRCNDAFGDSVIELSPTWSTYVQEVREELKDVADTEDQIRRSEARKTAEMYVLRRHAVEVEELTERILRGEIPPE